MSVSPVSEETIRIRIGIIKRENAFAYKKSCVEPPEVPFSASASTRPHAEEATEARDGTDFLRRVPAE
jgi:hypothetical protein